MISLLDKKQRRPYFQNRLSVGVGIIVLVIVIILILSSRSIGNKNTDAQTANPRGETFSVPLWRLDTRVMYIVHDIGYYFSSRKNLGKQITELTGQVETLHSLSAENILLADENTKLKALGLRNDATTRILATILIKPNRSPYDTIVVDAGTAEGVAVGQRVFARGNTLIGTVADVGAHTAHITLFSTPGQQTEGIIAGNDIMVTLIGKGGGAYEIDVPREVVLPQGAVVTNIATFAYPIAVIGTQISSERDALKRILAKTPINIQEIKWVEIAK
jgi:cell shape-determining protein MreC